MTELQAYMLLLLVGFLPSQTWRILGLVFARGIDEHSELFVWARAVATAILAGVIAKIILSPPGALALVPFGVRLAAIACGFAAYLAVRRSVFAGVFAGEAALILGAKLAG
ncbi:MAG: AzlD domain-containing protein [Xanthobacteraceae bacterium]